MVRLNLKDGTQKFDHNDRKSNAHIIFTQLAALWLVIIPFDLILISINSTVIHVQELSMTIRLSLVFQELLSLGLIVLAVAGPLLLIERLVQRVGSISRLLIRIVILSFGCVFILLFIASWVQFRSTGHFLDGDSIAFFLTNSVQLFQHLAHMEPNTVIAVPIIFIVCSCLLTFLILKLKYIPLGFRRWITPFAAMICIVFELFCFWARLSPLGIDAVVDPRVGMVYSERDLYMECRGERSGPAIHAVLDLAGNILDKTERLDVDPSIGIEWRSIIPMSEYLSHVDLEKLRRWNVILIIVESLRTDQLRAGGGKLEVMPNVDALAESGTTYINAYTQSSHSNYADLCPLSSHYPLRSSQTHVYPKQPTYPRVMLYDILKAVGYRTAVISSQNENWGAMKNYLDTGNIDHFLHAENFSGPTIVPYGDDGMEAWIKGAKRSGKIDDRYTVADAIRWIELQKGEPFFIYMNLQDSHVPYETPSDFPRRFGVDKLPFTLRFNQFPKEYAPLVKLQYANSLAYVDFQIGKLIDALKVCNQWDRTVIVVTGDTGQAFFEHGFAAHANKLFNEVMKVPIVVHAPGLIPMIDARLAEHVDIPPTILELLKMPSHPSFQGTSLLKTNPSPNRAVYLVAQVPLAHQYGIVQNGIKYIYDALSKSSFVFDLRKDPDERHNLEASADLYEGLRRRLDTWRKLQIEYYTSLQQHTKWYPPVLKVDE
jgi:arylsulfatase A-like enzyme